MKHFNSKLAANKTETNTEIHTKHMLTILKTVCECVLVTLTTVTVSFCAIFVGPVEIHNEK